MQHMPVLCVDIYNCFRSKLLLNTEDIIQRDCFLTNKMFNT